ncbi:hypothetical protein Sta7437_4515 (plasmid) [Stanieria cyanosphaera PCC 7437]|uniref:Uncharacterized protein n=1 Tax=Stanieria cyanosphaera (strain ATCC 29371 / PCC 7437) TaxID=111780 RepID=K9Y1V9_STAC7|nr:hypothetical protein [Stanieria cyanosphaera]AFZ37977.1 hypothetical protein Sta7437_4515 [Stanieria cyanosphaera PCC 7437]
MNQDALERLRNRAKPTVQSRDLSTIPSVNKNEESSQKPEVSVIQEERVAKEAESLAYDRHNLKDISNSSNQDVEISSTTDALNAIPALDELSSPSMDIKTKQSTIRLEQKLSQKLSQKCQEEEISREVFLEALFVYFENHKSIQSKVLAEARQRDRQRQKIANYRRAKSMIERFGNE